jgi:hypothetical protein
MRAIRNCSGVSPLAAIAASRDADARAAALAGL